MMRIRDVNIVPTDQADRVLLEGSQCPCSRYPELLMTPDEARQIGRELEVMAEHVESGDALRELEADHTLNLLRGA